MDLIVTQKSTILQPNGTAVQSLVPNTFDLLPIFDTTDENLIKDFEFLEDVRLELLDRATFATIKQRGADPVNPNDGIQWAESVVGEVSPTAIMGQVKAAVQQEGPGVNVTFSAIKDNTGVTRLAYSINITNAT